VKGVKQFMWEFLCAIFHLSHGKFPTNYDECSQNGPKVEQWRIVITWIVLFKKLI